MKLAESLAKEVIFHLFYENETIYDLNLALSDLSGDLSRANGRSVHRCAELSGLDIGCIGAIWF